MGNIQEAIKALQPKTTAQIIQEVIPSPSNATKKTPWDIQQQIRADIKNLRKAKGWTQRELARKARCSQGTITRIEKHYITNINTLLNIVTALDYDLKIQ